jgi:hypothetical protein
MKTLRETAFAADKELIAPMIRWRYNGQPAGNGWTSPANNGAFGTDYYHRTGAVKADPYDNKRNETMYFYTDNDTQLQQLDGKSPYEVTFPKGQLPPVKGFWSLTMYNPEHFFAPNALKRYALGTKNKSPQVQRRWQPDHISREQVAGQREGDQLASGTGRKLFDLAPCLLARQGHPRRHLEAAGRQTRKLTCPLLAQSRHKLVHCTCPLSEEKRTCQLMVLMHSCAVIHFGANSNAVPLCGMAPTTALEAAQIKRAAGCLSTAALARLQWHHLFHQ